jgi:uncharacterized protein YycO
VIIRLSSSRSLFSKLIKYITKSEYSHADIQIDDGVYVGSIPFKGVTIYNDENVVNESFFEVQLTKEQQDKVLWYVFDQLDKPYDYSGVWGFLTRDRKWQEDDRWFCSELVAAALNTVEPMFPADVYHISPADIAKHPRLKRLEV